MDKSEFWQRQAWRFGVLALGMAIGTALFFMGHPMAAIVPLLLAFVFSKVLLLVRPRKTS